MAARALARPSPTPKGLSSRPWVPQVGRGLRRLLGLQACARLRGALNNGGPAAPSPQPPAALAVAAAALRGRDG